MANLASELFYECAGLARRADGGFVPPTPPSARTIARLAGELDRAEQACSRFEVDLTMTCEQHYARCDRLNEVEMEYGRAIAARDLAARVKAENRKTPRANDAFKLRDAKYAAQDRLDLIEECRPEFATRRELLDANAAAVLAERLYEIAENKFQDAERQALADKRAGIVRHGASRITRL